MQIDDRGFEKAQAVRAAFGTGEPLAIAALAGLRVVYESWHPTTIGEFERKTNKIYVNRSALENKSNASEIEKQIVAHELGHFFAADLQLNKNDEESFAREFAKFLLTQTPKS